MSKLCNHVLSELNEEDCILMYTQYSRIGKEKKKKKNN